VSSNEKLVALMEDQEFNKKIESAATEEEASSILKEYGVYDEVMASADLSEEEMGNVAGGTFVPIPIAIKPRCRFCGRQFISPATLAAHYALRLRNRGKC
jgi:hypothetical protein